MKLFGRKKKVDAVPEEVREYYQAERRERTGLAWLLAAGTLVVTLILAGGIYFGGRWVYRTVTNDDKKPVATQTEQKPAPEEKPEENKPADENKPATPDSTDTGTSSTRTETPSVPAPTPSPAPAPATEPDPAATQPQATALVNTGPIDTVLLFVGVVVAGTLYHRFVLVRLK